MDESAHWYLMKNDDGTVFGPIKLEQLRQWATDAQVSPLDKVSSDGGTWVKAPMIPELEMDYLIEVSPDQFYGPTTLGAVAEFVRAGEITEETVLTHCRDAADQKVGENPVLRNFLESRRQEEQQPTRTSIRRSLQQRIRELEEALLEERRGRENAERLVERLELRVEELDRTK